MIFTNLESETVNDEVLVFNTINSWNPDEEGPVEGDWDDEDDEDFDDLTADLDDLHEIQVDDDLGEPDPEDDDHFPDDDEEDE
ncbi:MAG TPA: hypothetical protein VK668_18305 [Mucilaginibacter sp.]|nr:hypothetical protein [Mucilaginibacter sp.]